MRQAAAGPRHTHDFRLRSVAVSAYGPTILEAMGSGAAIPLVPLLARQLGATTGQAAFIVSLLGLGQLLCSLPAGTLIARIGERAAMVLAAGVGTIAALLLSWAPTLPVLSAATLLTGMMWTVFLLARQGFMIDAVPAAMRARALSTLGGSHRIGLFLGPILSIPLVASFGIRAAFLFSAALSLATMVLVLRVQDLGAADRAQARTDPASVWTVLRSHRHTLATLGLGAGAIGALRALRTSIVPLWADHIGLPPEQVSLLFALGSLVEIALFYPAGWLMDRRGRAVVAVPTVALLGLGLCLMPLAGGFVGLLAITTVMAVGNGLGSGIVMTLGADTAPRVHRAKYLGGWRLVGDLGMSGGPLAISGAIAVAGLPAAALGAGLMGMAATGWVGWWVAALDHRRSRDERMPT